MSIAAYIIRKIRLLMFFYLEYAAIQRWFVKSSRKPSGG